MAALAFTDSILDRILFQNGIYPADYDPAVDGPEPYGYGINGTIFGLTWLETHEDGINTNQSRLSDHVPTGKVQTVENFWNVLPGGEGESEIAWMAQKYSSVPASNQEMWVISIIRLFSTIEGDARVGVDAGGWRNAGDNGYLNKQNLKDWVNDKTTQLGGNGA